MTKVRCYSWFKGDAEMVLLAHNHHDAVDKFRSVFPEGNVLGCDVKVTTVEQVAERKTDKMLKDLGID